MASDKWRVDSGGAKPRFEIQERGWCERSPNAGGQECRPAASRVFALSLRGGGVRNPARGPGRCG